MGNLYSCTKISFKICHTGILRAVSCVHDCNSTAGMSYLFPGCVFIIIGLRNALSPFGAKSLPNPMLIDGKI